MDLFLILFALFCNAFLWYRYYKNTSVYGYWTSPWSLSLVYFFFNYPAKALYTYIYDPYFYTDNHGPLLLYYIVFIGCLTEIFAYLIKNDKLSWSIKDSYHIFDDCSDKFAKFLFLIVLSGLFYRAYTGDFYLFSYGAALSRNLFQNILINGTSLQWTVMVLLLHLAQSRSKAYYKYYAILAGYAVYESLVSSSKAPVFFVLLTYLFASSMTGQRPSRILVLAGVLFGVIIMYYSYAARFSGAVVQDSSGINVITETLDAITDFDDKTKDNINSSVFARMELLDNLVVLDKRFDLVNRKDYEMGSLNEVFNLIPKTFWQDRPSFSFNEFVQAEIMNYGMKGVTMAIGRIGEAYYLLKFFGVIYSVFYALISKILYKRLFIKSRNSLDVLIYIQLYFYYLSADNYLMQNLFILEYTIGVMIIVYMVTSRESRKRVG